MLSRGYRWTLRGLASAGALLALASAAPASADSPADALGVYAGARDLSGVGAFEDFRGGSVAHTLDFIGGGSWGEIEDPNWWVDGWSSSDYQVTYSIPMLPPNGASLQAGAHGDYNEHFVRLAQNLVDHGAATATLRIGWEFNGDWFPWSAKDDPGAFAAYWRQIVDSMRTVPGQGFKFDWNPTAGEASVEPDRAYPGDAYVDYIGTDVYDMSWIADYKDPQARWADFENRDYGLDWHADFAAQHGKQISIPEWGLVERSDGHGGGDNPYFIERMHQWIGSHDVAYADYFESRTDMEHRLLSGDFPQAAARFAQLFGSGTVAAPSRARTATRISRTPRGSGAGIIAGKIGGAHGGRVVLRLQRRGGHGWSGVGPGRTVSVRAHGRFGESLRAFPSRARRPGHYRVRARYAGTARTRSSASRYRSFRIKRP